MLKLLDGLLHGFTPLTITVDFDGTLVKKCFPGVGPLRSRLVRPVMQWIRDRGHTIVLNTCRVNVYPKYPKDWQNALSKAASYLRRENIPVDYINANTTEIIGQFGTDCRKISCNLDLDDNNLIPWAWWMVPFFVILREYQVYKNRGGYACHEKPKRSKRK